MGSKKGRIPWNKDMTYSQEFKKRYKFGCPKGHIQSLEHKRKLSLARSGNKNPNFGKGFHGVKYTEWSPEKKKRMRDKISKTLTGRIQSKATIEKRMKYVRGKITSKETKLKMRLAHLGKKKTAEHIKKILESKKRNNITNKYKGQTYNQIYGEERSMLIKEKIGKKSRDRWRDPKYIKKLVDKGVSQFCNTLPEIKMSKYLDTLGIKYEPQFLINNIYHPYIADFYIPKLNLIIEVDGKYWHNYPTGRTIDKIRTNELLSVGYSVLRFWEGEFDKKKVTTSLLPHLTQTRLL